MNNYPKTYVARVLMPVIGNDGDVVMRPDYDKALLRITELESVLEAAQKDAKEQYAAGQQFAATNMKVRIPTATMEQEFQSHYRRGYAAGQRDEREACAVACYERAKILEKFSYRAAAEGCAELIRARGEKP